MWASGKIFHKANTLNTNQIKIHINSAEVSRKITAPEKEAQLEWNTYESETIGISFSMQNATDGNVHRQSFCKRTPAWLECANNYLTVRRPKAERTLAKCINFIEMPPAKKKKICNSLRAT